MRSPRWKVGSIDPEETTIRGYAEPVVTHAVFQAMRAVPRILIMGAVIWSRRIATLSLNFAGGGVMGNAVKDGESEREDKLGDQKERWMARAGLLFRFWRNCVTHSLWG